MPDRLFQYFKQFTKKRGMILQETFAEAIFRFMINHNPYEFRQKNKNFA